MNALGKLFLKGLAVVIPLALTLAILWWLAGAAERLLGGVLLTQLPDGWYVPGMGLLAGVILTVLIGLLSQVLVFQKLFEYGEGVLNRLPLVKSIYAALKDFIDYFSPDSKAAMSKVVLVQLPDTHVQLIGFVTREDFSQLPGELSVVDPVAVYMPMSYQIGGYTMFVPRSCVTPLELSFEEGMKLVLTGAVSRDRKPAKESKAR